MTGKNSILETIELIENRITERLTVESISGSVYFSRYHYSRLFRETVGESLMEYVTKRKLTLAGRTLLMGNDTVLDIALLFGYQSHEGFTRAFKAYMGITPTQYRKFGLSAISKMKVKEPITMTYTKNTDEILRELNEWIVCAMETAEAAKKCPVPEYTPFWSMAANHTEAFADRLRDNLRRIANIAEKPDEITDRFGIIKLVEDTAFEAHLLVFNIKLMVARGKPAHVSAQQSLCERYANLAMVSSLKANRVAELFNGLTSMIFCDLRTAAVEKLEGLVQKGKEVAKNLCGYSYIRQELLFIAEEISRDDCHTISVRRLEDFHMRLDIISFAADADTFRAPADREKFTGIKEWNEAFADAIAFFSLLVKVEGEQALERTMQKRLEDIAYQNEILRFYVRGEISKEKLGSHLSAEEQKKFAGICAKIDEVTPLTQRGETESIPEAIAALLHQISEGLREQAEQLQEMGGAIHFLAMEYRQFAESVLTS